MPVSDGKAPKAPAASWLRKPPTRRGFVAMLGAVAAAVALRERRHAVVIEEDDLPPRPWEGHTRWIGHG
ncbi:MAG: hypothetical protein KIT31_37450 [Deltaproteobacteria bacterium]|nr:hypothetical protein [Deltaproteobacteria bacterium]